MMRSYSASNLSHKKKTVRRGRKFLKTVLFAFALMLGGVLISLGTTGEARALEKWIDVAEDFTDGNHGSGTEADPYRISTPQQMAFIAKKIYYSTCQHTTTTPGYRHELYECEEHFEGKHFVLTNEMDFAGKEWTPIGLWNGERVTTASIGIHYEFDFSFRGILNGNNHVIKNLTFSDTPMMLYDILPVSTKSLIDTDTYATDVAKRLSLSVALFNEINYGVIRNLGIDGDSPLIVNYSNTVQRSFANVAGIVGEIDDGSTVENCYNRRDITYTSMDDRSGVYECEDADIGGIAGCFGIGDGEKNGGCAIINCYNTGNITSTVAKGTAGGIVGTAGHGRVYNCYNTGSVTANESFGPDGYNNTMYAGGIAGEGIQSHIWCCTNNGNVKITPSTSSRINDYAGGITGFANDVYNYEPDKDVEETHVKNCHNRGSVEARNAGGIVGRLSCSGVGYSDPFIRSFLEYCLNEGSVSATGKIGGIVADDNTIVDDLWETKWCYYRESTVPSTPSATLCNVGVSVPDALFDDRSQYTSPGTVDFSGSNVTVTGGLDFNSAWIMKSGGPALRAGTTAEPRIVSNWSDLRDMLQVGGYIQLAQDVTFESGGTRLSEELTVPDYTTATLDLNGHALDRASTTSPVLSVFGNLTVTGSGNIKGGQKGIDMDPDISVMYQSTIDPAYLPTRRPPVTSSISVSGRPVITENTQNICLKNGQRIKVSGSMGDGAQIGVTLAAYPPSGATTVITEGLGNRGDYSYFLSDDVSYAIGRDPRLNEAVLGDPQDLPPDTYLDPTTYYPSDPAPEPRYDTHIGWTAITNALAKLPNGETATIDMNSTTRFPAKAIESIRGRSITLVLAMGKDVRWTICGTDVKNEKNLNVDVDMGVTRSESQIRVANKGDFGFRATLTLPMNVEDAGRYANLFRYEKNDTDKNSVLVYVSCGVISVSETKNGTTATADLELDRGGDYAIVVDDHSLDPNIQPDTILEKLTLKAKSKKGKVILSWKKLSGAKKYRVYQKTGKTRKRIKTLKKNRLVLTKAYRLVRKNGKNKYKKKKLKVGKKYTFILRAYVDGKWTKITKLSTKSVKVER